LKLSDFNPKNRSSKKYLDNFFDRLEQLEAKKGITKDGEGHEETAAEIEARFAEYRRARFREKYGPGPGGILTFADAYDKVTDEEIDFYCKEALKVPPEQRYQIAKKRPPYHNFVYTSLGIHNATTGWEFDDNLGYYTRIPGWHGEKGCNDTEGCVPACKFFNGHGRIEDSEIIALYEKWKRDRDALTLEGKREERQRVHNYNLVYDDDTPEQRLQWQQKREKWRREHPDWKKWF
jgi:hypothetical protein